MSGTKFKSTNYHICLVNKVRTAALVIKINKLYMYGMYTHNTEG